MNSAALTLEQVLARSMRSSRRRFPAVPAAAAATGAGAAAAAGAVAPPVPSLSLPGVGPLASSTADARRRGLAPRATAMIRNHQDLTSMLATARRIGDWEAALTAFREALAADASFTPHDAQLAQLVETCIDGGRADALHWLLAEATPALPAASTDAGADQAARHSSGGTAVGACWKRSLRLSASIGIRIVSSLGAAGNWAGALAALQRLPEGPARCTAAYNSALSACEVGGAWEAAIAVFGQMRHPPLTLVAPAVGTSGLTEEAREALRVAAPVVSAEDARRPVADAVTYAALIATLEGSHRTPEAAALLATMPLAEKEAVMCSYAALIDVWSTKHSKSGARRF